MEKKFIPIIGTISAGKSTFLRGFLGVDVLQTGQTTTTKFVCLIKNSSNISFYHVIPKNENGIIFEKDGSEIKTCEEIKKSIVEINDQLTKKKGTKNDIFYMLEIPIKNIDNESLLDNCYFMDIPGLNEKNSSYIDDIFSIITIDDILFEIMIFDSNSIGSDNILTIFQKLNDKNCLLKKGNLYILNKLDKCFATSGIEDIIDNFKNYFYQQFEDEKNESKIEINFSENHFIPMNSLLYQAETKFKDDFYSLLLIELFNYIENADKNKYTTFCEYLKDRLDCIIAQNNIEEKNLKDIDEESEDMEIIKQSINKLDELKPDLNIGKEFTIGIRLDKKRQKQIIKKLFIFHKSKLYDNYYIPTESFTKLQEIIKNFKINNLGCPPSITPIYDQKEEQKEDFILNEMNNFLREKLKNQFDKLDSYLRVLSENLLGRKIRISFIGNISVGKSTVLNSIIGENILPTSERECTYRGIIIKHKNIKDFHLFRAKIKEIGDGGLNKYYSFEESKKPYCSGISNIQSYLKNKNNDKNMSDQDAFIVIHGKLKIFDFVKFEQELIEKIEFVDLPGHDRKGNKFNKEYYDKILLFSNCCIYINEPKTIDDETSVKRIQNRYRSDKLKLHYLLRPKFISSCLFLINKSDNLSNIKDKRKIEEEKLKNSIIDTISKIEGNISKNNINICFFSGNCFNEYLQYYNKYIDILESRPLTLLNDLYTKYSKSWFVRSFKNFINNEGEKIEEKLNFELEEVKAPSDFSNKLKTKLREFFSQKKINSQDQEEIINTLYSINYTIKNTDFSDINYSLSFFEKLKEIINFSENIQKQNLKLSIQDFFKTADKLFERELKHETENEKKKNEEEYNILTIIIAKIKDLLEEKQNKIIQIIQNSKKELLEIIEDEIKNAKERIKDSNGKVEEASSKLEKNIKSQKDNLIIQLDDATKTLKDDIINLVKETIDTNYKLKGLSPEEIEAEKEKTKQNLVSIVLSALKEIATNVDISFVNRNANNSVGLGIGLVIGNAVAGIILGPFGLLGGLITTGIIVGLRFFINLFSKESKYKDALSGYKKDIEKKFEDILNAFLKDFEMITNSLINKLDILCDILYKKIDNKEIIKEWEKIKSEYEIIKEKTKNLIEQKFN